MIRPRTLRPRTFCPCAKRPRAVHPDFLTFPYVSSLKEPGCSKRPFSDCNVPACFIHNGKGSVLKLLVPVFLGKDQKQFVKLRPNRTLSTHGLVGHLS